MMSMYELPILLLLRADLRLDDNPALAAAADDGRPVIPVYILDDDTRRPLGVAARWWLHGSLERLGATLAALGSPLILRRGATEAALAALVDETGATEVWWNHHPDIGHPSAPGIATRAFDGCVLWPPGDVVSGGGTPYKVFTPFWKTASGIDPGVTRAAPRGLRPPDAPVASDDLRSWALRPTRPDGADGLCAAWTPGEAAGQAALESFLATRLDRYGVDRDRADGSGSARLSPYLRFGELSPRRVWHAALCTGGDAAWSFLRQVAWRDFAFHQLARIPNMAEVPLRPTFEHFPWRDDGNDFAAWTRGHTGYPLVDAAMRQLWVEGWIPNRPRMVAGSFLVKHLLLPWQWGERWFWDCLVDACPANNPMGWQWVAGCGIDAAPYFRIFNPTAQAAKFDPGGTYVRRWAADAIHPIVGHRAARARALAAMKAMD